MITKRYTYKFRLYPNEQQKSLLAQHFGNVRYVYNYFLSFRKDAWENDQVSHNFYDCSNALPSLKSEFPFLKLSNSQSLQDTVLNLDKAYKAFFSRCKNPKAKHKGYPSFKRKFDKQSFKVKQNISLSESHIYIPKFDGIKVKLHRPIEGVIKSATVSKMPSGKYFVAIQVERDIPRLAENSNTVGIDLNVKYFVDSNAIFTMNPLPLKRFLKQIKRLHHQLSKKVKGSNNYAKVKLKLAKLNEKIANIRRDHLEKLSRRYINENQVICLEDLDIKQMIASQTGFGKKAKRRNIFDCGFYSFKQMILWKAGLYGREVKLCDRFFPSSKTCSSCSHIQDIGEAEYWSCEACKAHHHRDVNSALNLTAAGTAVDTCGVHVRPPRRLRTTKQEASML